MRVPGQRRLAISRSRVPNLDGFVATATSNLLSIGAPRHRVDTVIVIVRTRINRNKAKKTKKTYKHEGPVSVDSHSRVPVEPTDQIFTVLSMLPLASLPSLLHATDITL